MSENLVLQMPEPTPPKPARAPRFLLFLLALLIIAGCAAGWIYMGKVETSAQMEGQYVPIAPLMTAKVTEVLVTDGQMVRAGQPLARLDNAGLSRMESDARALVRGTRNSMEDTAERVAAAQAAEEYTVRRVALARHEEETLRREVERRAHDHARAQLHMRNLDAKGTPMTAQVRREAQQAEVQARSHWEAATDAFESSSRARAAVEGELRRAKQEAEKMRAAGNGRLPSHSLNAPAVQYSAGASAAGTMASASDPSVITAPQDGRVLGKMPEPGQLLARGETVLRLAPGGSSALWGIARISQEVSAKVRPGQICFVLPGHASHTVLVGEVEEVAGIETDPTRHDVVPVRIRVTDDAAGKFSAQLAGQPARVIIWGNALPGMGMAAPWLARWGIL